MNPMNPFRRKSDNPQPAVIKRSIECVAHGCPMPGVWSNELRGNNFVCRVHDGVEPKYWPAITDQLRRRVDDECHRALDMQNDSPKNSSVWIALSRSIRKEVTGQE